MTLHRWAAKRDASEPDIVEVLQKRGFSVDRVSAPGFPDLVVTKRGAVWFVEVKRPKGTFTQAQLEFRTRWQGPAIHCLRSIEDAIQFPADARACPERAE